jgi:DNA helicase-2/ATP-dependent DNA helicase PcrA
MTHVSAWPSADFIPSPYQQAVFDFVARGRGSAIVKAVAGSGKTTTILKALDFIPDRCSVQLFAFNSTIAAELRERVGERRGVRASTFHSVGFGAVCKHLGKSPRDVKTDGSKSRKLFRATQGEDVVELYGDFVCKLVGLAKGEGLGVLVPDTDERWFQLIQHHDLYLDSEEASDATAVRLARTLLEDSNRAAKESALIDFDDQLYLPLLWRLRLWQNDFVFVDEAQDTNPVRRALAKLALRPGGRLIAVGDPRQAIYGFTGASHDALDLIQREFSCVELPLTVSYRCPRAVVRLAQTLVPYLEAHDGAAEGEVLHLPLYPVVNDGRTVGPAALDHLGPHDAIACRNTAPLIGCAYELIARGTACTVLGRDIGAGLVNLIKQMRARTLDAMLVKLARFEEREVAKHTAAGEEQKAEAVTDRVACVRVVVDHLHENERTLGQLILKIEGMFSDTNGALTLATAHKLKGKEYDVVAILRPDLMPSRWARQAWQREAEENLMYVAWTRAKRTLIFLED